MPNIMSAASAKASQIKAADMVVVQGSSQNLEMRRSPMVAARNSSPAAKLPTPKRAQTRWKPQKASA
ncbi:hypothetical protein JMG10_30575 [Nostoc ellipsosporum NOK]|nr:hypothetical protein [Nostoc ellipsosporum NOK]